jgi:hypothetical protein
VCKKNSCIAILLFSVLFVDAQKDSLGTKSEWLSHFIGIDFGYTSYDNIIGFKGETNINYVFNPHYFCAKIQLGVSPGSNFGALKKGFASIGFSTKTNKFLSWHFLTGLGIVAPSDTYQVNRTYDTITYTFYMQSAFFESGFYLRPLKNKRLSIGLNSQVYRLTVHDGGKYPPIHDKPTLTINLSLNLKLINKQ